MQLSNNPAAMKRRSSTVDVNQVYERINNRINKTGGSLIQTNGQRVYSSPDCPPDPMKGCEVFVGKIPRDVFEDELLDKLESIGKICKLRLMMDFNGHNRGYAFVTYYQTEIANLAVSLLHNLEIRPGRRLGIYKSIDNCRLFVGGVPQDRTKEEVYEALAQYVDGIQDIIMYSAHTNRKLNRGFVFVEFEEHRMAALARRKLSPGSLVMWGVPILVDWAEPLPDVDPYVMSRVSNLYFRNLDISLTQEGLLVFLTSYIPRRSIVKIHKSVDYAFVHFTSRTAAEDAFNKLRGKTIQNEPFEIMWARPRIYSKGHRSNNVQDHFCSSLPPKCRKQILESRELHRAKFNPPLRCPAVDTPIKVELPKPISPPTQLKVDVPIACRNFNLMFQPENNLLTPFLPPSFPLTNLPNGFGAPYYNNKFYRV